MNLIINEVDLKSELYGTKYYYCGLPFSGFAIGNRALSIYKKGYQVNPIKFFVDGQISKIVTKSEDYNYNGYCYGVECYDKNNIGNIKAFQFWDCGLVIESFSINDKGEILNFYSIENDNKQKDYWVTLINYAMKNGQYEEDSEYLTYYNLQNELKEKVIVKDELPSEIKYIAGVDVAYNELEERVVAGIVVLDAKTLQIVEEATHEDGVSFPYVPGLFSFREVPPLLEAFNKLKIKPDLIVCDGHGIAHPKGVGMATHLGIELNIPTIGCAKKRLVGFYEEPESKRGSNSTMVFDGKEVGKALRTQDGIKPVFVSVGHKISLETACEWILHLTPNYRLPETTRAVDSLVNKLMKERTDWDTPLEFYQKKMEEQQNRNPDIK